MKNVVVIGAGGWGTTLATVLANNKFNVKIWGYEQEVVDEINNRHKNSTYLEGVQLPKNIEATSDTTITENADFVVNAIPTQYIRKTLERFNFVLKDKIIVNGAKGIENKTLMCVSKIFEDVAGIDPEHYVVLSGPSHAEEVARKMPTTVVAASKNRSYSQKIQESFSNNYFRVYSSDDIIGCELGGALKNIIAIAAGIIDGLELGDNTKAALITRGLAEMSRLGIELGADALTFSGLSGLGDLIVTCDSRHSRNRSVGEKIGKGMTLDEILKQMKMVAEGVNTTISAVELGKKSGIEMPIAEQVHNILFENMSPRQAINELMNRKFKSEWW